MATNPTVSSLRKVSKVTDDEITAAVDAVLPDMASEAYPLAEGCYPMARLSRSHRCQLHP